MPIATQCKGRILVVVEVANNDTIARLQSRCYSVDWLGKQLVGHVEDDEVEFEIDGGMRRVLIVRTERQPASVH